MKGFAVFHNGERVCTAGIGDTGGLMINVHWIGDRRCETEDYGLHVGGYVGEQVLTWPVPAVKPGDEITIRLVEVDEPDTPTYSHARAERAATASEAAAWRSTPPGRSLAGAE